MEPNETPHVEMTESGVTVRVDCDADAAAALVELRALRKRFALAKRALNERQRALRAEYTDDVRHRWPIAARGRDLLSLTVRANRSRRRAQLADALAPLEREKQRVEQTLQAIEAMRLRVESMKGRFAGGAEDVGAQPVAKAGLTSGPTDPEPLVHPVLRTDAASPAPARPPSLGRWRAVLAGVSGGAIGLMVAGLTFPGKRPIPPNDMFAFVIWWGAVAILLTYLFRHSLERKLVRRWQNR